MVLHGKCTLAAHIEGLDLGRKWYHGELLLRQVVAPKPMCPTIQVHLKASEQTSKANARINAYIAHDLSNPCDCLHMSLHLIEQKDFSVRIAAKDGLVQVDVCLLRGVVDT